MLVLKYLQLNPTHAASPPGSSRRAGGYSPVLRLTADDVSLPYSPVPKSSPSGTRLYCRGGHFGSRSAPRVRSRTPQGRFPPARLLHPGGRCGHVGYGSLLGYWLHKMGVDPPAGVFLRAPGKPGRPRSAKTEAIFMDLDRSGQALALPPETGACGVPGRVHERRQRRAEEDDRSMPTRRGALASPITTKPILNKS